MKRIFALFTLLSLSLTFVACQIESHTSTSKSSSLSATLDVVYGDICVGLSSDDQPLFLSSPMLLEIDGTLVSCSVKKGKKRNVTESIAMPYGEFREVTVSYTEQLYNVKLTLSEQTHYSATFVTRLYADAFAYRWELKGLPESTKVREAGRWNPANANGNCYAPNGEHEPLGGVKIQDVKRQLCTPFIYNDGKSFVSLHECDLLDYPQLKISGSDDGKSLVLRSGDAILSGDVALPWRVVMVGSDFQSLHNQKPIYQSMSRPAQGDFSWVEPGISMWDWRVKGTNLGGFTYEMNTASMKRFIDFCSRSNLKYLLIDAEWHKAENPLVPIDALDLEEVVAYGNSKGVGIILYYDMNYTKRGVPAIDFETVAKTYAEYGVKGMKYGFLTAKTPQQKTRQTYNIIETLAKYKLIVDFHDAPIPFSGLERTYPNYINREFCHAQLDRRTAFTPRSFVKMACVNLLAGHIDQTNGTFALNEMASRLKGPRNPYNSTVSAEVARFVITHTGSMSVLIDAPEAYSQKADLFSVISNIPATWDETRYLDMNFNSHVAVARRKGDVWYAAVVYNERGGEYEFALDFLSDGATYNATIYRDAPESDCVTNKESYDIIRTRVTSADKIKVKVASGGGFTVIFNKL